MHPCTHLGGKIPPFCNSLVVHSHTPNSSQDDILGNLHSQASHTRDEDIGVLHALHSIMAQHVAAGKSAQSAQIEPKYTMNGDNLQSLEMWCLQLSGVQAFIDFSIISILSHALCREIGFNNALY